MRGCSERSTPFLSLRFNDGIALGAERETLSMRNFFNGIVVAAAASGAVHAETMDECLFNAVKSATATTQVGELREFCKKRQAELPAQSPGAADDIAAAAQTAGVVEKRLALERYTHDNPFVLTPHRPNYLLPISFSSNPNRELFERFSNGNLQNTEVEFQLSLKVLIFENLLGDNGHLSFAYTNRSFWQAYNREISAPFRDSNHEPEVFFTLENDTMLWGMRNSANQFFFNHQSNGRGGELSRSWNRLMFNSIWEKDSFVLAFTPWYRLPEDRKRYPLDPDGDDNPDIEHYLGHFELRGIYQIDHDETFSVMLRNNLRSDNKGAIEFAYSFPIGESKLRGYLKYFNGYGSSLVDYNHRTQTLGLGFLISDWL